MKYHVVESFPMAIRAFLAFLLLVTILGTAQPMAALQASSEYNCLWLGDDIWFPPGQTTGRLMVNLVTGKQIKSDPLPAMSSATPSNSPYEHNYAAPPMWSSPNERYIVKWGGARNLYLQSAGEEHLFMVQQGGYPGDMRVGQGSAPSPFPDPFPIQWSPNSQRFAYSWKAGKQYYLTIFNVETRQKEFTAEDNGEIALWVAKPGWSADSHSYVFQGFGKDGPALQLWSVLDAAVVQSISGARAASSWSPDKYIAYIRDDNNRNLHWLGFASASSISGEIQLRQYDRYDVRSFFDSGWSSRWSSNGQYLVLRSNGVSHGMDLGSSALLFSRSAQITPDIEGIIGSPAVWTPDGRSLVFLQMRGSDVRVRDLTFYHIEDDKGVLKILLRNVAEFYPGPTKLAVVQILENDTDHQPKTQAFLMDYDGANQEHLDFDNATKLRWAENYLVGFVPRDDNRIVVNWIDPQNQHHSITTPFEQAVDDLYAAYGAQVLLVGPGQPSSRYLLDLKPGTLSSLGGWPIWSPDGQRMAYIDRKTVIILDPKTTREIQRITTDLSLTHIGWIPCP